MRGGLTNYDKILKELQIIETIFHSQMNPDMFLGGGMELPRYCNEIFIVSDVELFIVSEYKREYTSRLEQSINTSLVFNELKTIYTKSTELCIYYVTNLHNHPDKREFFVGADAEQQIIESRGSYNFLNYRVSFGFFGVGHGSQYMNIINSTLFKDSFRYRCKNITLANFCEQLLKFIDLSEVLIDNRLIPKNQNEIIKQESETNNPFPLIFTGNDDKAYNVFMDFKKNVTDYYRDYSFIFQKMIGKAEKLIQKRCRHKEFMDWLFVNKHISEKVYNDFTDKESFSTKYDRGMRVTQYNTIKEKYFPINSDLSE
jgi:hypothetical protein